MEKIIENVQQFHNSDELMETQMNKRGDSYLSPTLDLLIFSTIFGWEGPLSIWMGFNNKEIGLTIVGLLITLFLWGLFGLTFIEKFLAYWFSG